MREQRICDLWNLYHGYELLDLEKGFFLVHFYSKAGYHHVLENGLWIVLGHYLTISKLRPNFKPSVEPITSPFVWICLPEMPVEFFNKDVLTRIENMLGKSMKIDATTTAATRGALLEFALN